MLFSYGAALTPGSTRPGNAPARCGGNARQGLFPVGSSLGDERIELQGHNTSRGACPRAV